MIARALARYWHGHDGSGQCGEVLERQRGVRLCQQGGQAGNAAGLLRSQRARPRIGEALIEPGAQGGGEGGRFVREEL